jgi:hypothetical protein
MNAEKSDGRLLFRRHYILCSLLSVLAGNLSTEWLLPIAVVDGFAAVGIHCSEPNNCSCFCFFANLFLII